MLALFQRTTYNITLQAHRKMPLVCILRHLFLDQNQHASGLSLPPLDDLETNQQADLEDKILKKNIPGKYTWWDKDSDEEGEGARADWVDREASDPETEMTELEKQQKWVENDCPEPIRRTIMAREEKERARTGVKGVLADFDAWKLSADAGGWVAVVICSYVGSCG